MLPDVVHAANADYAWWAFIFLVALCALNFRAKLLLVPQSSVQGRYWDLALSWWKINFTYRSEALSLQRLLEVWVPGVQLIQDRDLGLVVSACTAALASPTVRTWIGVARPRRQRLALPQ